MEIKLDNNRVNYVSPVCKTKFKREETMELIVPDAQPNILKVICTNGIPFLRGKEAVDGRVTVSGIVEVSILYMPENTSQVQKITANLPFSAFEENKDITTDSLLVADVSLVFLDAKMMNPRKLMVRAELAYDIQCYQQQDQVLNFSKDAEKNNIFFRNTDLNLKVPASVTEKTFVVTDELLIPVSQPRIDEILNYSSAVVSEDIKSVGNKAVIKGNILTKILYRGEEGEICKAAFSSPYSQIVETDIPGEAFRDITIMLTGVYISRDIMEDSDADALSLEVHAVAQCVSYLEQNVSYLSDAYSPKYEIESEIEEKIFYVIGDNIEIPKEISISLDTLTELKNIYILNTIPISILTEKTDGQTTVHADIRVSLLYKNQDDILESGYKKAEVVFKPECGNLSFSDISLEQTGEISLITQGITTEIKIPVIFKIKKIEKICVKEMSSISYNEQEEKDTASRPSLIIHKIKVDDELWDLAKKYNSSVELINAVNPNISENNESDVIIIPKIR